MIEAAKALNKGDIIPIMIQKFRVRKLDVTICALSPVKIIKMELSDEATKLFESEILRDYHGLH